MKREWKPGDVAMSSQGRVFGVDTSGGVRWVFDDGSGGSENAHLTTEQSEPSGLRPLVVIDPEDREQVERLLRLGLSRDLFPTTVDDLQAALREFANPTPPKPEEPTGLGAVVEAVCGCRDEARRFVRHGEVDHDHPWKAPCGWHVWAELGTVTRVLSEGVTA